MIVVKLMGGLGNQMFQYAAARALSIKTNTKLYIDESFYIENKKNKTVTQRKPELHIFKIKFNKINFVSRNYIKLCFILTKFIEKKFSIKLNLFSNFIEDRFNFNNEYDSLRSNTVLIGYFQTEKYFIDIRSILLKEFLFNIQLSGINFSILQEIKQTNSVSVHIRRGDYISSTSNLEHHGICTLDFYKESINYMTERLNSCIFFVFSDDIIWAKENFNNFNQVFVFIDYNTGDMSFIDMMLMSNCKNNIIANSSFSWWGAWLNQNNQKIVIAPKKWFNSDIDTSDLIPSSWIRI